jgi:hypothetical protein
MSGFSPPNQHRNDILCFVKTWITEMKNAKYLIWIAAAIALAVLLSSAGCNSMKRPNGVYTNNSDGVITTIEFTRGRMSAKNNVGTREYEWKMASPTEISLERKPSGETIIIQYDPESDVVTLEDKQYTK